MMKPNSVYFLIMFYIVFYTGHSFGVSFVPSLYLWNCFRESAHNIHTFFFFLFSFIIL